MRCLQQQDDGTLLDWRGALPFLRITPYTRQTAPAISPWGGGAEREFGDAEGGADLAGTQSPAMQQLQYVS